MNKVIMSGRFTKDIELRYTANNTPVGSFTLAVDKRVKQGEEKQADFLSCTAWGKTAETMSKYLAKGSKVLVEGRLQTSTWEDTDGKKHYKTEVVVESFEFLDSKKSDSSGSQITFSELVDDVDGLPF